METLVAHAGGKLTGSYPNYTLHQNIWLNTNDTLMIAAGSVITIVDGAPWPTIVIWGTLRAEGTESQPILFTSGPLRGGSDTSDRCLQFQRHGVTNSVIEHVIVEHSRIGIALFDVPSLVLSNITARYNDQGIYSLRSSPRIVNSLIHNNGPGQGIGADYGSPVIERCTIYSNETLLAEGYDVGGGILMRWVQNATITDCEIRHNFAQFGAGVLVTTSTNVLIQQSRIHANDLLDDQASSYGLRDVQLEFCSSVSIIRNRSLGECLYFQSSGEFANNLLSFSHRAYLLIEDCSPLIAHNYFPDGYYYFGSVYIRQNSSPLIANNVFYHNGVWVLSPSGKPSLTNNYFSRADHSSGDYFRQHDGTMLTSMSQVNALPGSSGNFAGWRPWNYLPSDYSGDGFVPPDSPTVDAGIPLTFRDSHLDLEGRHRPFDGNLDGNAVPDVGPLELQRYAVTFLPGTHGEITSGNPFQMVHLKGAAVAPIITPFPGVTFTGWDQPFNSVTQAITVTAQYNIPTFTLTYTTTAFGTLLGETTQHVLHSGNGAPVTAVPAPGHQFWQWSDGVTNATRHDLNVTSHINVQARYTTIITNLTVSQIPGTKRVNIQYGLIGSSSANVALMVTHNGEILPATAVTGHIGQAVSPGTARVAVWNMATNWNHNAATGVLFKLSVVMPPGVGPTVSVATATADLDSRDHTLQVISSRGGPIPAPGTHAYPWHAVISASAGNQTGYTCIGWAGTGSIPASGATSATGNILLTNLASSIEWLWQANSHTLTFDPMGGQVDPSATTIVFDQPYGPLPVPIRPGYEFQGWWTDPVGGSLIESTNRMTINTGHTLYARWPHHDYVLNLDGSGHHVRIPYGPALDIDNTFTIEAWIKPANLSGRHTVFSSGSAGAGSFAIEVGSDGTNANRLAVAGANGWTIATSGHTLQTGQWHHIAYTRAGAGDDAHTLYINGVAQPITGTGSYIFTDTSADRSIGAGPEGANPFSGRMDELRVWNSVRADDEILDAIHRQLTNTFPELVARYAFDYSAADDSANALHGQWVGEPSFVDERAPLASAIADYGLIRGVWKANPDAPSSSMLALMGVETQGDADFLLFGHDHGDIAANTNDVPERFLWRLDRAWRTDGVGTVDARLVIQCAELLDLIADTSRLRVLASDHPSFVNAVPYFGVLTNNDFTALLPGASDGLYLTIGEWNGETNRCSVLWMPQPDAYWPFDGDDLDHSGNENHGEWVGGSFVEGQFGLARQFTTGEYFTVWNGDALNNYESLSMMLWFQGGPHPNIVSDGGPLIGRYDWLHPRFGLWFNYDYRIRGRFANSDGSIDTPEFTVPLGSGEWHHYGVIYHGDAVEIFFDGSLVATSSNALGMISAPSNSYFRINYHSYDLSLWDSPLSGAVERVYVFPESLTHQQVRALYEGRHPHNDGYIYFTTIAPTTVSGAGGDLVTISGLDLGMGGNDITGVTLCGIEAEIISQTSSQVVVAAGMSMTALTGTVTVYSHSYGPVTPPDEFIYLAPPVWTVELVSAHGQTDPPPGLHDRVNGSIFEVTVTNPVVQLVDTQIHATGWAGTGSAINSMQTSISFQVLSDSRLELLWSTSVWWQAEAMAHGTVNAPEPGWYPLGSPVEAHAYPADWHDFSDWTGDVPPDQLNDNPLYLDLDRARRIAAQFQERLTTQGVPLWWLHEHGADPSDEGAEALAAGGYRYWQHHIAGTDPNDPDGYLLVFVDNEQFTESGITVEWRSVAGRYYSVDRSTNLNHGFLRIASDIMGQSNTTHYVDMEATAMGLYIYRIGVRK